jgi:hypothetical protein
LRVAEQANEENIIGKEHLPLDFEQAVFSGHAVPASMPFLFGTNEAGMERTLYVAPHSDSTSPHKMM